MPAMRGLLHNSLDPTILFHRSIYLVPYLVGLAPLKSAFSLNIQRAPVVFASILSFFPALAIPLALCIELSTTSKIKLPVPSILE